VSRPAQSEQGLLLGSLAALRSLSRHRALDRLIRGRIWIALIAFALIGIVALQLLVLQLNASIGRALVREAQLQRENAALSIEGSELAAGERVESQAAHLGMQLVPEGALRFLSVDPRGDVARAAAALSTPVQVSSTASGEASTAPSEASTAASAAVSAGAAGASGEQAAAASTGAQASSEAAVAPAGEADSAAGDSSATSSAAPASSTATEPSPASSTAGATGATVPEAAPAGASSAGVGAGGAGPTQADGAG
jgi:cell division protein FtsL